MNWMSVPDRPDASITAIGPYQALVHRLADNRWQWTVVRQPAGQPQQIVAQDVSNSRAGAQAASEAKLASLRRPGRLSKGPKTMTASQRSKSRVAKLAAKAVAADEMSQRLEHLNNELGAAGLSDWAKRVGEISRTAALKAVSEYTRRNATFFVTDGPHSFGLEERAKKVNRITRLANKIDELAEVVSKRQVEYPQFESILHELHESGFWPENTLVFEVARAFHQAGK